MRLVATSSIALVIFFMPFAERMRWRRTRTWAAMRCLRLLCRLMVGGTRKRLALELTLGGLGRRLVDPRRLAPGQEVRLEVLDLLVERGDDVVVPLAVRDRLQRRLVVPAHVVEEVRLEPPHVADRDVVELALDARPDHDRLFLD